ncbi:complement C1q-like protein 3 [Lingula anatina]|uniref:Complement C1q-like protein 3 n=1 Tax=Lingula anatina TaxID=7574 RepID=A0A1S3J8B7_LINAN|nr:complement C1q-like protein 3 [Lingula anatina]|eukprot:XP_013406647.1 complement C1q-like protein 3 [Lingula anatina]
MVRLSSMSSQLWLLCLFLVFIQTRAQIPPNKLPGDTNKILTVNNSQCIQCPQGPKGYAGDNGPQGIQGPKGQKGEKGYVTTITKYASPPKIAFTAKLTKHHPDTTTLHTVRYDTVVTNFGDGFNKYTGIFSVPMAGTYFFIFHGLTNSNKSSHMELVKNGEQITSGYGNSAQGSGKFATISNSAILEVRRGDKMWVQASGGGVYGYQKAPHASFSGYLIYANEDIS